MIVESWGNGYTKDEYGNVYQQGRFVGRDLPTAPQPYGGGYSTMGGSTNIQFFPTGAGLQAQIDPYLQNINAQRMAMDLLSAQQEQRSLQLLQQQHQAAMAAGNQQRMQELELQRQRMEAEMRASQERIAIDRERLAAEKARDEAERQQRIAEIEADPRRFVQSLFLRNMDTASVRGFLESMPLVQSYRQGQALPAGQTQSLTAALPPMARTGTPPTWEQIQAAADQALGAGWEFMQGRKLPVRETLMDIETKSPRVGLLGSLASFGGQDPNAFFGEFQQYLPKGGTARPLAFR